MNTPPALAPLEKLYFSSKPAMTPNGDQTKSPKIPQVEDAMGLPKREDLKRR